MSFGLSAVQHKKGTSQLATLVSLNGPITSLFHFFFKNKNLWRNSNKNGPDASAAAAFNGIFKFSPYHHLLPGEQVVYWLDRRRARHLVADTAAPPPPPPTFLIFCNFNEIQICLGGPCRDVQGCERIDPLAVRFQLENFDTRCRSVSRS